MTIPHITDAVQGLDCSLCESSEEHTHGPVDRNLLSGWHDATMAERARVLKLIAEQIEALHSRREYDEARALEHLAERIEEDE